MSYCTKCDGKKVYRYPGCNTRTCDVCGGTGVISKEMADLKEELLKNVMGETSVSTDKTIVNHVEATPLDFIPVPTIEVVEKRKRGRPPRVIAIQ